MRDTRRDQDGQLFALFLFRYRRIDRQDWLDG
jgi:hypothetical protein